MHQRKNRATDRLLGAPRRQHLCHYIPRPTLTNERLKRSRARQVVLQLKTPYQDDTMLLVMSPLDLMQRLAAVVFRPKPYLRPFHGVLALNA